MPSPASQKAAQLVATLAKNGYVRVEPAILQPAAAFIDVSGEDLRRRMFLTADAEGNELCLRPDLTIPTARQHIAAGLPDAEASYCYLGPVFRHREQGGGEFMQAGMEIFGRKDCEAADAEILARSAEALEFYGVEGIELRLGDRALFNTFIDALEIPAPWRRRLVRDVMRQGGLGRDLASLAPSPIGNGDHTAFLAALDGADPKAAKAVVEDMLSIAGISQVGGRSAGDIAERFLEQARLRASASLPEPTHEALTAFLTIESDPISAIGEIRALLVETRLSGAISASDDSELRRALDSFEKRNEEMADRGLDVAGMSFATSFGRQLDYYTGLTFEFRVPRLKGMGALIGGGRYDNLLQTLGASAPVPAVGCAIFVERIEEAAA